MDLAERLGARLERVGEHELWRGATNARGVPVMKVDGRLTTVRRVVAKLAVAVLCRRARRPAHAPTSRSAFVPITSVSALLLSSPVTRPKGGGC